MIKQECIGIPEMILLLMNFLFQKKIKIKAEIVLSPGGASFIKFAVIVCFYGCQFLVYKVINLPQPNVEF